MTKNSTQSNWDSIQEMLEEVMERRDERLREMVERHAARRSAPIDDATEEQISEKRFRERRNR